MIYVHLKKKVDGPEKNPQHSMCECQLRDQNIEYGEWKYLFVKNICKYIIVGKNIELNIS